jgi:hypothetical protein
MIDDGQSFFASTKPLKSDQEETEAEVLRSTLEGQETGSKTMYEPGPQEPEAATCRSS